MPRPLVVLVGLVLVPSTSVAASRTGVADDPTYTRANARLARATPHYPAARLLIAEPVGGEIGSVSFEAVQRVYFLARPQSQRTVMRFYGRKLGGTWRIRAATCLVSRTRLIVALVHAKRRRLGVLVDSRGATRCKDLAGLVGDLLEVGYPDE